MANQNKIPNSGENPENEQTDRKKTFDVSQSAELLRLRARCAADTMQLKRSTVRIPLNREDVVQMPEEDFVQYVVSTIETARLLVLDVLEQTKNAPVYVSEWSDELEIDNETFNLIAIRKYVSDKIKSIDTLKLLGLPDETSKDFKYSKQLLEEVQEKLSHRRSSRY